MANIPLFNFKEYIDGYSGRVKLLRIHHLVKNGLLDEEDELLALKISFDELTVGTPTWRFSTDSKLLESVSTLINGRLGPHYTATPETLKDMNSLYNEQVGHLTCPLRYRLKLAREKENEDAKMQAEIQDMTHFLGWFQYRSGYPLEAYTTLSKIPVSVFLMLSAMECRKFEDVCSLSLQQHRYIPETSGDGKRGFHLKSICFRALAHMASGCGVSKYHYYTAARLFANVIKFFSSKWSTYTIELFTWDDLFMYCTWCAMATMSREELTDLGEDMKEQRVGHAFQHMIREYLGGRFASSSLAFLETHQKPRALLDIFLGEHVDTLSKLIREREILKEDAAEA